MVRHVMGVLNHLRRSQCCMQAMWCELRLVPALCDFLFTHKEHYELFDKCMDLVELMLHDKSRFVQVHGCFPTVFFLRAWIGHQASGIRHQASGAGQSPNPQQCCFSCHLLHLHMFGVLERIKKLQRLQNYYTSKVEDTRCTSAFFVSPQVFVCWECLQRDVGVMWCGMVCVGPSFRLSSGGVVAVTPLALIVSVSLLHHR